MIKIRRGEFSDIKDCIPLSRTPEFSIKDLPEKEINNYIKEFLKKGIFLIAEENKKVKGYLIAEKMLNNHLWIDGIVVDKKERGKGIGKRLLSHLKKIKKNKRFYLMAPQKNKKTINFYEKFGMKKGDKFIEFYLDV